MTHLEEYTRIINFRKSNPLSEDQYGENHHIKPKSIYPELKDDPDNIVRLSAQEHFLAHYHLWLAYRDELKNKTWAKKMCFAFHQMKRILVKCNDIKLMAKLYDEVRTDFSKELSAMHKGKPKSTITRQRMSDAWKGVDRKGVNNPMFGKHLSDDAKKKIGAKSKGRTFKHTDEAKRKISIAHLGNKGSLGKHWFNNGIVSIQAFTCPDGYVKGRVKQIHADATTDNTVDLESE